MPSTDSISNSGDSFGGEERRQHARQAPHSLAYIHLDEMNGGILLNLGEGGLAVQAAMSVMEDDLPKIRLQAPRSTTWLETSARVVWSGDSRRTVGIQFVDMPEGFQEGVRDWLAGEIAEENSHEAPVEPETLTAAPPPSREELRARGERYASAARTAAQRDKEFDLAALLTSTEQAKAALARSSSTRQEITGPVLTHMGSEPKRAEVPEKAETDSAIKYVPLLILLSAISLFAGWEFGRGNVMAALFQSPAAAPPAGPNTTMLSEAAASAAVNFEVVDATNQSWLVPYAGPTTVSQSTPTVVIPPRVIPPSEQSSLPAHNFEVGTLTAPKSADRTNTIQAGSAPSLPDAGNQIAVSNSVASAIGDTGTRVNVAPPPIPAPAPIYSALVPAQLLRRVDPSYPKEAIDQRIDGTVKVHAHITESGSVTDVKAISGSRLLEPAAIAAVRQWQYKPEFLDGKAVASDIDITISFTLPK
jgi:TonB family protein